jgi:hypothetical protein
VELVGIEPATSSLQRRCLGVAFPYPTVLDPTRPSSGTIYHSEFLHDSQIVRPVFSVICVSPKNRPPRGSARNDLLLLCLTLQGDSDYRQNHASSRKKKLNIEKVSL